jgi:hypothetical protein
LGGGSGCADAAPLSTILNTVRSHAADHACAATADATDQPALPTALRSRCRAAGADNPRKALSGTVKAGGGTAGQAGKLDTEEAPNERSSSAAFIVVSAAREWCGCRPRCGRRERRPAEALEARERVGGDAGARDGEERLADDDGPIDLREL